MGYSGGGSDFTPDNKTLENASGVSQILNGLGTALQQIRTNSGATAIEWFTPSSSADLGSSNIYIHPWTYSTILGSPSNSIASDKFMNASVSTTAQNDEIRYQVYLPSGTYTIWIVALKTTTQGIATIELDDVTWTTIDMYNASTVQAQLFSSTGLTVATAGLKNLDFKIATKNASSSGYQMALQSIYIVRTGA